MFDVLHIAAVSAYVNYEHACQLIKWSGLEIIPTKNYQFAFVNIVPAPEHCYSALEGSVHPHDFTRTFYF